VLRRLTGPLLLAACAAAPPPPPAPAPLPSATRDFDGDGFADPRDRCPRDAGVAPFGCPDPDEDSDGFSLARDRCPKLPGVAPDGCPPPDGDRDNIADADDRCHDEQETQNGFDDLDGCADKVPKDLAKFTGTIKGVSFELDKDKLKKSSNRVLDRAAAILKKYPSVRIEISGHIDSTGSVEYSNDLSRRRAVSVKQYLVDRGIDPARLATRGAGPDEPLDTNKTAEGRARNRRIEFTLLVQ
jgi:OOP family OmpA-OmpF porin